MQLQLNFSPLSSGQIRLGPYPGPSSEVSSSLGVVGNVGMIYNGVS